MEKNKDFGAIPNVKLSYLLEVPCNPKITPGS